MVLLTFESYAIMTELGSCLVLYAYYRSVTRRNQRQRAERANEINSQKETQQVEESKQEQFTSPFEQARVHRQDSVVSTNSIKSLDAVC